MQNVSRVNNDAMVREVAMFNLNQRQETRVHNI